MANYYLLTELVFRTVKYQDQGLAARTELPRSMRKGLGLNISQYKKHARLINSLLYAEVKIFRKFSESTENF